MKGKVHLKSQDVGSCILYNSALIEENINYVKHVTSFLDAFLKKPIQEKWNLSNLFILTNLALFGIEERKGTKLPLSIDCKLQ